MSNKSIETWLYLVLLWGLCSCSNSQVNNQPVLRHVVLLQFKEEVSIKAREQAVQNFLDLKGKIPEILNIEGGKNISEGDLSKGFTHCFVLTFEDESDRDIYLPHPEHMRVVEENKPLLDDLLVADFWGEE